MSQLNEYKTVTALNTNDYAVLTLADGSIARIKRADLSDAIANVMRTATATNNGLMTISDKIKLNEYKTIEYKSYSGSTSSYFRLRLSTSYTGITYRQIALRLRLYWNFNTANIDIAGEFTAKNFYGTIVSGIPSFFGNKFLGLSIEGGRVYLYIKSPGAYTHCYASCLQLNYSGSNFCDQIDVSTTSPSDIYYLNLDNVRKIG